MTYLQTLTPAEAGPRKIFTKTEARASRLESSKVELNSVSNLRTEINALAYHIIIC